MKDLYADLMKYYRFMVGKIPKEDSFLAAIKATVTHDDLRVFFLLPFTGSIQGTKLAKKAEKANITSEELHARTKHMLAEGFVQRYTKSGEYAYERGNIAFMSEQQVRKHEDTPRRRAYAEFMDALIEGETGDVPNRTPYYRTIPVESTISAVPQIGEYPVNRPIPDSRAILPIDIASEMVKAEPLIGVADCYCRSARLQVGKECEHPLETCLVFNEIAETLIDAGIARKIEHAETLNILQNCEEAGLIHFVDNVEGHIKSMCNCCACSCVIMSVVKRGGTNAGGVSRFIVSHTEEICEQCGTCAQICPTNALLYDNQHLSIQTEKCIGCGLCVSRCPNGALQLIPREKYAKIFPTNDKLWSHITRESVLGMALNKLKR
ncbi:MAG: 4Fe-4S binding protein [Anaerolineaceae bacterium]|nr:4Fe-4S binding protein [Anaerolineaceae bacterium]